MENAPAFKDELASFAADLRRLRIDRGKRSYREIAARAERSGTGIRLPVATQSDAFRGERLLRLDRLMGLVRILHGYDAFGREQPVPPHGAPELEVWRRRWRELAALDPGYGRRAAAPVPAPPVPSEPAARGPATERVPAPAPAEGALTARFAAGEFRIAHRLIGHSRLVWHVAFSPDGRTVASAGNDGTVRLWSVAEGRAVGVRANGYWETSTPVLHVAFSPVGDRLVALRDDGVVDMWDPVSLAPLPSPRPWTGLRDLGRLRFLADGRLFGVVREGDDVQVRDLDAGRAVGPFLTDSRELSEVLALSPDGSRLAATDGFASVQQWHTTTGEPLGPVMTGHSDNVEALAYAPDGRLLATGSHDATARLWDTGTGRQYGPEFGGHDDAINAVAFSPDGRLLATAGSDRTVRLWDTATGSPVGRPLGGHTLAVNAVAFSPDGRLLATGGDDQIVLLHRTGPEPTPPASPTSPASSGTTALAAAVRECVAVPLPALRAVWATQATLGRVRFSPDGSLIVAVCDADRLLVWDPATWRQLAHLGVPRGMPAWGVDFGPGAAPPWTWASQGLTPPVRLTYPDRTRLSLVEHLAYSPDGRLVALTRADGAVMVYDAATSAQRGGPFAPGESAHGSELLFSPDGRLLAVIGQRVRVWDTEGGTACRSFPERPGSVRSRGAFAHDGAALAVIDRRGSGVALWDPWTGEHLGPLLEADPQDITEVAFSPSGGMLATVSNDGSLRLWDRASGFALDLLLDGAERGATSAAFSPDGSLLAAACDDGTLRLWLTAGT